MELLKEFIIAIGGGITALVALLTIFKNVSMKYFESGISAVFEKNLEKYKNKLIRSTTAYEILLNKEIDFYNKTDPILAELIILVQDLAYTSDVTNEFVANKRCEEYRQYMLRLLELINEIKNELLLHQVYLTDDIFNSSSILINKLQKDLKYLEQVYEILSVKSKEKIDNQKMNGIKDSILKQIADLEILIKARLTDLAMME